MNPRERIFDALREHVQYGDEDERMECGPMPLADRFATHWKSTDEAWEMNHPHAELIEWQSHLVDVLAPLVAEMQRQAWDEGATSRQCHCSAYDEGECACGMWPSDRNPYLPHAAIDYLTHHDQEGGHE